MKYTTINLGCKVNRVEIDQIAAQLEAVGYLHDKDDPDAVVVNTCTVTGEAEKKTRKAVRQALKRYPGAYIFVTGCAVAIDPDEFRAIDPRVICLGKAEIIAECERRFGSSAAASREEAVVRFGEGFRTRAGIKVQDGCDHACTYCIVHTARGPAVSRPLPECVDEVALLERAGAHEAVITGINLGSYEDSGVKLPGLLEAMRKAAPSVRLRVSSVEPCDVGNDLIRVLAGSHGWVCRHLHLPLQSGSERVLREMDRPYSAEMFASLVGRLYESIPGLSLSTDIIVGFPGETDADFEATMDMVRTCRFTKVHVFRYSKREGTPAAARDDQVDPQVISHRAQKLQALADQMRYEQGLARIGAVERVLVCDNRIGISESYYSTRVPSGYAKGDLFEMELSEFGKDGVFA